MNVCLSSNYLTQFLDSLVGTYTLLLALVNQSTEVIGRKEVLSQWDYVENPSEIANGQVGVSKIKFDETLNKWECKGSNVRDVFLLTNSDIRHFQIFIIPMYLKNVY
ncbi:hypothetical protein CEXT_29601 [Caerostris extrusa]|uniref:Uncharacterized protein n=1 Tax=Caerostris extrusa TaxID=172846 RepID=A0AAV4NI53_CAEEX|nr:hypothetical protein CEXT_29601 [Caerostris extrusa]